MDDGNWIEEDPSKYPPHFEDWSDGDLDTDPGLALGNSGESSSGDSTADSCGPVTPQDTVESSEEDNLDEGSPDLSIA